MKNQNTMSLWEYILENLILTVAAMVFYRKVYFVPLQGTTVAWSVGLLWLVVIVAVALGGFFTFHRRRNNVNLLVNLLLPFEIYTALAYYVYIPGLVWSSVIIGIVFSVVFILLATIPDKRSVRKGNPKLESRLKHGLLGARTIVAVSMLVLFVPLGWRLLFGHGVLNTAVQPVKAASQADEWTVKNNIETVRLLKEDEWSKLDLQEKLDVLGVVLNIEIHYLGLNHELYLNSARLDNNTAAYYDHSNYAVAIDIEQLESAPASEILDSLCHECYHSYQHQMIELYAATPEEYRNMLIFQYVDEYIEEFSEYTYATEDSIEYYFQAVERTARNYAAQAVEAYYELIEEYTAGDEVLRDRITRNAVKQCQQRCG